MAIRFMVGDIMTVSKISKSFEDKEAQNAVKAFVTFIEREQDNFGTSQGYKKIQVKVDASVAEKLAFKSKVKVKSLDGVIYGAKKLETGNEVKYYDFVEVLNPKFVEVK